MRADTGSAPSFTPAPPPRPTLRHTTPPRTGRPAADVRAEAAPDASEAEHPLMPAERPDTGPPAEREARLLTLSAFAVAATALLMPFTALVSLALSTVGYAKGDETLGRAAFLASMIAMAAGFALNLTVLDIAF